MGEKRKRGDLTGHRRKDGRWEIQLVQTLPDGTTKTRSIYGKTQGEVQEKARKILMVEGRRATEPRTMEDLLEVFEQEVWPHYEPKTLEQHRPAFARIRRHKWPKLDQILPVHVADLMRAMAAEEKPNGDPLYSGRTIQAYRNVLSRVLGHALSIGWVSINVAKGVRLPPGVSAKPKSKPRLTPHDYAKILKTEESPVLRDLWEFLGEVGFRPDEALKLRKGDIFYSLDAWWIRGGGKTPAGTDREVILPDKLAHRLQEREDWLFPSENKHGRLLYRHMLDLWVKVRDAAGVDPRVTPYGLRKLAYSRMVAAGVPDDVISAWFGHADTSVLKDVYNRLGRERIMGELFSRFQ